jgi:hypothetical protein
MRLTVSTPASLVLLATACANLLGCSVHNQVTCDGNACTGGGAAIGGGTATGGTTSIAGTRSFGGSSTTATGGTQTVGGASSTLIGSSRTGGTSAITSAAAGASSVGGTKPNGGASSVGGTKPNGGASSVGGTSCGVADTDTDGDGVPDCSDICPQNAAISKSGTVTFDVVFGAGAQAATYAKYLPAMESNMIAAGQEWATHFVVAQDVTITVQIDIVDIPTANGKSADSVFVETVGNMKLYQMSATSELLTGRDSNGSNPDIEINFGITPLTGADGYPFWFEPDPTTRTSTMPSNSTDGYGTCLHELGHSFGFNGWRDWATGLLPDNGDYESYYDYMSSTDGADFFFEGTRGVASYGKKVPETYGNISHIGNNVSPHPGFDLGDDLMRGTVTLLAHRYYIGDLDLAILADVGVPIRGTAAANAICSSSSTPNEPPVITLGPRPNAVE